MTSLLPNQLALTFINPLCSQKVAPVERNTSIASALTTLLGVFVGFDELLECDSEVVDFVFDTGLGFIGKGAANTFSRTSAKEKLAYYDMQTKQRVFNFPIYLQ